MVNFIENQQLWYDTVLSFRTRVEKSAFVTLINHISNNIEVLGLEATDNIVLTVDEEISDEERTIFGVEVIVPVNKPFPSNSHYVYKPVFKLENALLLKYTGKASEMPDLAGKELVKYAAGNNMSALTNVYYCIKQLSGDVVVAYAYMGINGNRL